MKQKPGVSNRGGRRWRKSCVQSPETDREGNLLCPGLGRVGETCQLWRMVPELFLDYRAWSLVWRT